MLGDSNSNHILPVFLGEGSFQCYANTSNQLQLFGNLPARCADPANPFGHEHQTSMLMPNKLGSEAENFMRQQNHHISLNEAEEISRRQKLQISLNYNNISPGEADRTASSHNKNPVSTGLRLSYDDDEPNSTVTSCESMTAGPSIILSLGDGTRAELALQEEEFNQYIKIQHENLAKGVREMKRRHMTHFLASIQRAVKKKLCEKDLEIENMNRKSCELVESINQLAVEAQNWHNRAKYSESLVNFLKTNLQHEIPQGANQQKEGFGDSEVDDAASYIDPKPNFQNECGLKEQIICQACKSKEVSILLIPCRHLCICKECNELISICPVCQSIKTTGVEVYSS